MQRLIAFCLFLVFATTSGAALAADTLEGLLSESVDLRSKAMDVLEPVQTVDDAKAADPKLSEIAKQIEALAERMKKVPFVSEAAEQEATKNDAEKSKAVNERIAVIGQRLTSNAPVLEAMQEGFRAFRNANSEFTNARSLQRSNAPKPQPMTSSGQFSGVTSIPDWITRSSEVYGGPDRYVRFRIEGLTFADERNAKLISYLSKTLSSKGGRAEYAGDYYEYVCGPVDPDASKIMQLIDLGPTEYDKDKRTITLKIDHEKFDKMFKVEPATTKPARQPWKPGDPMKQSPRRRPASRPN